MLLLLAWPLGQALADGEELSEAGQAEPMSDKHSTNKAKDNSPKKGKTIWLEEKISPSTQWLEGLVKPMTSWMEGKIQKHPDQKNQTLPREAPVPETQNLSASPDTASIIDADTIARIAGERVPGQILRMKLLERNPLQYRVKLISKAGEIHMLYINAHTGELIQPSNKPTGG